jgi:hypothetical protein
VVVAVVTVVVTRVVDEVGVEIEETVQGFGAGEVEDEEEGPRWRFIREPSFLYP